MKNIVKKRVVTKHDAVVHALKVNVQDIKQNLAKIEAKLSIEDDYYVAKYLQDAHRRTTGMLKQFEQTVFELGDGRELFDGF